MKHAWIQPPLLCLLLTVSITADSVPRRGPWMQRLASSFKDAQGTLLESRREPIKSARAHCAALDYFSTNETFP